MSGGVVIVAEAARMIRPLLTRMDTIWHTALRVVVAVVVAVAATLALSVYVYGTETDALVKTDVVIRTSIYIAAIVAAVLTAGLSFRSAVIMQQLALARAELLLISRSDELTGLLNRRGFDEATAAALRESERTGESVTVMICDIDSFKDINDRFGHESGDEVLKAVAVSLRRAALASGGIVARYRGGKFLILVAGNNPAQSLILAETLRKDCDRMIPVNGASAKVSISIGLAVARTDPSLSRIMHEAEGALFEAKRRGGNQIARSAIR